MLIGGGTYMWGYRVCASDCVKGASRMFFYEQGREFESPSREHLVSSNLFNDKSIFEDHGCIPLPLDACLVS